MTDRKLGYVVALLLGVALAVGAQPPRLDPPLPPCPTEDSIDCFWDASEQGNGVGSDVTNLGD